MLNQIRYQYLRTQQQTAYARTSTATIVAPAGVSAMIEIMIPQEAHITDSTTEHIVTDLKLPKSLMADKAGNITSADMRSDPTRFIASTIMTAMIIAIIRLYASALIPVALEKSSSNVTAKILL